MSISEKSNKLSENVFVLETGLESDTKTLPKTQNKMLKRNIEYIAETRRKLFLLFVL